MLMIVSKFGFVFFITLDCKLHQKLKNDQNDVKSFTLSIKALILNDSH